MATRDQAIANRIFDDFQPLASWVPTETSNTLTVNLPGFQREQLRVQLDDKSNILISGERPLVGNRWARFRREFRIPENSNISEIRAKFENETLYVLFPQIITPASASDKPTPNPQATDQSDTNPAQPKPSPQVREETKAQETERVTAQPKPTPQFRKDPKAQDSERVTSHPDPTPQFRKDPKPQTSTTQLIQPKQNPQIQNEPKHKDTFETRDERPKEHINGEQKEPIEKKNDTNARSSNERNIVDETTREKHKDTFETREGKKKEQMLKQIEENDDGPQYDDGPKIVEKGPNRPIAGGILGSSAQDGMGHVAGLISGLIEPKQLIVNMVVAFSVVVGLGAYVIYKFMPTHNGENEEM